MTSLGESVYVNKITAAEIDSMPDTGDNRFVRMGQLSTTATRVFEAGTVSGGVETVSAYINDDGTSSFFGGAGNVNNPMTADLQCGNFAVGTAASPVGNIQTSGTITSGGNVTASSDVSVTGATSLNTLSTTGNAIVGGTLVSFGQVVILGNAGLSITGATNSSGGMSVSGDFSTSQTAQARDLALESGSLGSLGSPVDLTSGTQLLDMSQKGQGHIIGYGNLTVQFDVETNFNNAIGGGTFLVSFQQVDVTASTTVFPKMVSYQVRNSIGSTTKVRVTVVLDDQTSLTRYGRFNVVFIRDV